MNIKRTIISTIVALALVAVVAPGVAQGDQLSDLIALVAQLQAQITALQGGGSTGGSTLANCTGVTFTRNLTTGSTGSDVKCLQTILNQSATTKVATTGAGSPGNETSYFGPRTLVSVKIYQQEHGWTPANQVGPMTRQALNASLGGTIGGITPPVTPVTPVTGGGLSVGLAVDTPATGTVPNNGNANFTKVTLTAGS